MKSQIIIAIDGYSSCGKSTLAKALANHLGYIYIDSGAMYRAATLFFYRKKLLSQSGQYEKSELVKYLSDINIYFKYNSSTKNSDTYLNDSNVETEIRTLEISNYVSIVSQVKEVRDKIVAIQREMGKSKGIVMDGRDIGSNVFPNAELKIFMTADEDIRTQRRFDELISKGEFVTFDQVKLNLRNRDYDDTHRTESPLIKVKDAIVLDNSELTKEQQLKFVEKLIHDYLYDRDE